MSSQTVGLDVLLTVDEAAQALRVSAQFAYRYAIDGDLPSVSVGKAVRVRLSVVQAVIDGDLVFGAAHVVPDLESLADWQLRRATWPSHVAW